MSDPHGTNRLCRHDKHLGVLWIHNIPGQLIANTICTALCVPVSFYIRKNICTSVSPDLALLNLHLRPPPTDLRHRLLPQRFLSHFVIGERLTYGQLRLTYVDRGYNREEVVVEELLRLCRPCKGRT